MRCATVLVVRVLAISTATPSPRARLPAKSAPAKVECVATASHAASDAIFLAAAIAALHRKCLPDRPECCEPLPATAFASWQRRSTPALHRQADARAISTAPGKAASPRYRTCAAARF